MSLTDVQKEKILQLFCRSTHAEISGAGKTKLLTIMGAKNRDDLTSNSEYNSYFSGLEELLLETERIAAEGDLPRQVRQSLSLLSARKRKLNKEMFEALMKLIDQKLGPQWPANLQTAYSQGREMVAEWIHVFVSYTNQSAPGVNNGYKDMLLYEFRDSLFQQHKDDFNLMAGLIYEYFALQKLNVFYDKKDLFIGDRFKEKLEDLGSKSFVFTQFIEAKIFNGDPPKNYCYKEYDTYSKNITKLLEGRGINDFKPLLIFLISNPEKQNPYDFVPAGLDEEEYKTWIKDIEDNQYLTIYAKLPNEELKIELQKAAKRVLEFRTNLFSTFLNSIN
jgi:hypothetical protein